MEMSPGVAKQAALTRPTIAREEEARLPRSSGHVLIERRTCFDGMIGGSPVDGSQKWFTL